MGQINDYFGLCPQCVAIGDFEAADSPYLNVGSVHYKVCDRHNSYWRIGSNLFSDWIEESAELHTRNAEKIRGMQMIEPYYLPETIAAHAVAERDLAERTPAPVPTASTSY